MATSFQGYRGRVEAGEVEIFLLARCSRSIPPLLMYDVFLSYGDADSAAVEFLAHKLEGAGLTLFLGRWHLVPGEPSQEGLEAALSKSRTCAVFLGRKLGNWQNEVMRSALAGRVQNRDFRVIPVLLPGAPEPGEANFPPFLGLLGCVDFRRGLADETVFRRLLAGIRGEVPGSGAAEAARPPVTHRSLKSLAKALAVVFLAGGVGYVLSGKSADKVPKPGSSASTPAYQPRALRGEILDASTGSPLPGVVVQLPEFRLQEISDAAGQYRFEIPLRTTSLVKLRATRDGYIPLNLDLTPGSGHLNVHRMWRTR